MSLAETSVLIAGAHGEKVSPQQKLRVPVQRRAFYYIRQIWFDLAVSCIQNDLSVKSSYHTLCTGMDSLRYVAFPVL